MRRSSEPKMTDEMSIAITQTDKLPRLIERAATALAKATTAAEVLDARDSAALAYDAAKAAARFANIKNAHDAVLAACHKAMGDALEIEAQAQCRLADEYDAAQERGEVKTVGKPKKQNVPYGNNSLTVEETGLTRKRVHEARLVRDAEKAKPGLIERTINDKLSAGEAPTRAQVKRAVREALTPPKPEPKPETAREQNASASEPATRPSVTELFGVDEGRGQIVEQLEKIVPLLDRAGRLCAELIEVIRAADEAYFNVFPDENTDSFREFLADRLEDHIDDPHEFYNVAEDLEQVAAELTHRK